MKANYLETLTNRLADGVARLPETFRRKQIVYLRAEQNADGGFSGREGGSDLYYTGFGLRGLAVLQALTPEVCEKTAGFLRYSLTQQASAVDFFSLLYSCFLVQLGSGIDVLADSTPDWPERVAALLETLRTADGGYAKTAGSPAGSTYHTFLIGLCYQLLGRSIPEPDRIASFLAVRRREDGGFVELMPMRKSGTNPTAAAVGMFQLLGVDLPSAEWAPGVIDLLAEMPSMEGGLRNGRVPLADLLSTFTGCWTLDQLGGRNRIDKSAAFQYADALALPSGGFRGGLWDERADVEYTFYGLSVLALLAGTAA